jgi:hypothetical protein
MKKCIEECLHCHQVCLQAIRRCLAKGGRHADFNLIRDLTTCAEVCQTTANLMIWGSHLYREACGLCAQVCEQAAMDCAAFENDKEMTACAEVCALCAHVCSQVSSPVAA